MDSKTNIVGEILRHINAGRINLIICSAKFKSRYYDEVELHYSGRKVTWVEFDAKSGTMNVSNYDLLMKRSALLINDFSDSKARSEYDEAAELAMSVHDTKIVDRLYFPISK
jgi:hypothetical protein